MLFWLFAPDPFGGKKLKIFVDEDQISKMIDKGIEDFQIDRIGNEITVRIPNTFWNRRKLKKLKITFESKS